MSMTYPLIVNVRYRTQAYTCRFPNGVTASSTNSPEAAVERLMDKVWEHGTHRAVRQQGDEHPDLAVFEVWPVLSPCDGMTVELEDHGQDFLEFDIKDGRIVETRPFQGDVWNGLQVINETIGPGDYITVQTNNSGVRTFHYPVVAVRPLEAGGVQP